MSCYLINEITSLENDVIDLTHSFSLALDRLFTAIALFMTYTCFYDYEIMQPPDTGGIPCVLSNITT